MSRDNLDHVMSVIMMGVGLLWGHINGGIQTLLIIMFLDLCMEFAKACQMTKLDSHELWGLMMKKFGVVMVVVTSTVIEPLLGGVPAAAAATTFFAFTEALSILQTAMSMGLTMPPQLAALIRSRIPAIPDNTDPPPAQPPGTKAMP